MSTSEDRPRPVDDEGSEDAHEWADAIRELSREIEPARDLWPGIEARIRERQATRPPTRRADPPSTPRRVRWTWGLGLAAAAGLAGIGIGSLLIQSPGGNGGPPAGPEVSAPSASMTSPVAAQERISAVEEAYEPALSELRLLAESADLSPETRQVLNESLETIDAAIREAQEAVEADPLAPRAVESLRHIYERKIDLLRVIAERSSST